MNDVTNVLARQMLEQNPPTCVEINLIRNLVEQLSPRACRAFILDQVGESDDVESDDVTEILSKQNPKQLEIIIMALIGKKSFKDAVEKAMLYE